MRLTNHREYADEWAEESAHLDALGIYATLADLIPDGPVLEIGCGTGRGSAHLVRRNPVLSLDNNPFLLEEAVRHVAADANFSTHQCDLLDLSATDLRRIEDFKPATIVAWFLGAGGADVFSRTSEQPVVIEKGKLYREKIEDVITSSGVLVPSVLTINLVNRGGRLPQFSDAQVAEATAQDHDDHVFGRCGFGSRRSRSWIGLAREAASGTEPLRTRTSRPERRSPRSSPFSRPGGRADLLRPRRAAQPVRLTPVKRHTGSRAPSG